MYIVVFVAVACNRKYGSPSQKVAKYCRKKPISRPKPPEIQDFGKDGNFFRKKLPVSVFVIAAF